jgi:hypothetical protein
MPSDHHLLQQIRIASPCSAAWDEMNGDDRVRFCDHCDLNVYNLSTMSAQAAAALVREKEGRLCVRFYARRDGTMLVRNCPVGFGAARRLLLGQLGAITGAFALIFSSTPLTSARSRQALLQSRLGQAEPFKSIFTAYNEFFERLNPDPFTQIPLPALGRIVLPTLPAQIPADRHVDTSADPSPSGVRASAKQDHSKPRHPGKNRYNRKRRPKSREISRPIIRVRQEV